MHALAKFTFVCTALAGALAAPFALAAGGGGGGGGGGSMSSSSSHGDSAAAYQAGVTAMQAQNYREAIRQFRNARRGAQHDGSINFALGLAYVGNGDRDEALSAFERAARAINAPVGARVQMGLIYIEQGKRENAIAQQAALAEMLANCTEACGAERRAQLQAGHDQLTQALAAPAAADPATTGWNFPSIEEGRAAYAEAVGLINQDRYAAALDALSRAQAAIGPHPDVLNYMGFASRKSGDLDAALAYYDQALALDPNHLGATEYLGELYLQMGDLRRARTQLAQLDQLCAYGCAQREELARWIARAE
jgi:tetratricopeptide (TPR) repeat protein